MTNTATPGHNTRLAIYFTTDRNGRRMAFRWSTAAERAIRINVDKAEMFIAQGQADKLDSHPFRS